MRIRTPLVKAFRRLTFTVAFSLPLAVPSFLHAQVSVSMTVTPEVQMPCNAEPVRVKITAENPGTLEIAGFQFFVEYPADQLEPMAYEPGDFTGLVAVNGVSPFGVGFDGCPNDQADPWADGQGLDRVGVVASVFDADNTVSLTQESIDFGALVFQVRSDAARGGGEIRFPTSGCSPFFFGLNNIFDPTGNQLGLLFRSASGAIALEPHAVVENFTCDRNGDGNISLSWDPPSSGEADGFVVYKDGEKFLISPTVAFTEFEDDDPPGCGEQAFYEVAIVANGIEGPCRASCVADGSVGGADFIRGDVDSSGRMNITDAVNLNLLLFLGDPVQCQDAADYDDSGSLDTSDTIGMLLFQFSTGLPPAAPYPEPGQDPTDDDGLEPCCIVEDAGEV